MEIDRNRMLAISVIHLMDYEWYTGKISVYHHEDAVYFDRGQIVNALSTALKRRQAAAESVPLAENGIIYSRDAPRVSFKMLGEAATKQIAKKDPDLYNGLIGTIIPYALRFIIRRDIRVMRNDMKQMQATIAKLMKICDARVSDNDDICGQLVSAREM